MSTPSNTSRRNKKSTAPSQEELDAAFHAALSDLSLPRYDVYRGKGYRTARELSEQYGVSEYTMKERLNKFARTKGWSEVAVKRPDGKRVTMYKPPL